MPDSIPAPESPEDNEASSGSVRAVDRAIAILQAFTPGKPSMSVIEIQKAVGISRPTVYRLLNTLMGFNLIQSEGDPQRFRLGHGVIHFAQVWLSGLNVVDIARPYIARLREETGETAALFVRRNNERLCVLEDRSREVLSISRGVGDTGSILRGASGKIILAFMEEAQRDACIAEVRDADERKRLVQSLEAARNNGFAVSHGEVFLGAVAIAAPYFDYLGNVAGSVGLFGPNVRLREEDAERLVPLVKETAANISQKLGHSMGGNS